MLEITPTEIAAKAAHLAYTLPNQNQQNCPVVLEAFDNYISIAKGKLDCELQYFHTVVLTTCRKFQRAKTLLEQIAKDEGKYSNRAALDLIKLDMRRPIRQLQRKQKVLEQLQNLIERCSDPNQMNQALRTEALGIYSSMLLESTDSTSANHVLDIIAEVDTVYDPNLLVFKPRALMHLGRLGESANYMAAICPKDHRNNHIFFAASLLGQIIDNIDRLQQSTDDFPKIIKDCQTIARYCYKAATTTDGLIPVEQAGLYMAEISLFESRSRLSEIEKLLAISSEAAPRPWPDFIRCKARLLMAQGKREEAAKLWAQLVEIHKDITKAPNARSEKWWRAKYFQLHCSYTPASAKNIIHTIDVLQSSFADIPVFWAIKFDSLKRRCENQLTGDAK
jgi:tetratricopeptide (TPR) repeat protein